jgi:hypothetical protein
MYLSMSSLHGGWLEPSGLGRWVGQVGRHGVHGRKVPWIIKLPRADQDSFRFIVSAHFIKRRISWQKTVLNN